jgi:stringent starvation protein B
MQRPTKREVALALMQKGSIFLHLDPRREHVVVPQPFRMQPELVLQFGLNLRVPIPDLEVDENGVTGTLSFARRPFWCRVPWSCVYVIAGDDGQGMSWPEDAPRESKFAQQQHQQRRPKLRAVGPDEPAPSDDSSDAEGHCALCSTKWASDASACPVCGASREEAFVADAPTGGDVPPPTENVATPPKPARPRPALAVVASEERPEEANEKSSPSSGDGSPEPPPEPPPKRPHLRLVK